MKKNKLISLLAIPILVLSGCTNIHNDQIRILDPCTIKKFPYDEKEIKVGTNIFRNSRYGSDIITATDPNGYKLEYVGSAYFREPHLDFFKKSGGERDYISNFPEPERTQRKKEFIEYSTKAKELIK